MVYTWHPNLSFWPVSIATQWRWSHHTFIYNSAHAGRNTPCFYAQLWHLTIVRKYRQWPRHSKSGSIRFTVRFWISRYSTQLACNSPTFSAGWHRTVPSSGWHYAPALPNSTYTGFYCQADSCFTIFPAVKGFSTPTFQSIIASPIINQSTCSNGGEHWKDQ